MNETSEINIRYPVSHISSQKNSCKGIGSLPIPTTTHNCYKKLVNEMSEIHVRYLVSHISRQKNSYEGIGGLPIPVPVVHDVQMNTLVRIGGPSIRCSASLTTLRTLYCRNTKKPTKAKWLLGKEYEMEIDIECKGLVPRMAWRMCDKIKR